MANKSERLAMIEPESPELFLKTQAELPGISRSSLRYCSLPPSPEEVTINHHIGETHIHWPF
ncbi:MAG: hypothetical protein IT308_07550 [Anaerolineaceae bacterium]|nr:hypothetical protein [Anaerolineaceae bacterium]